jgi:hypothetical protein
MIFCHSVSTAFYHSVAKHFFSFRRTAKISASAAVLALQFELFACHCAAQQRNLLLQLF